MLAFSPEQFITEGFADNLTPPTRRNEPEQLLSESIVDRHVEFSHVPPQDIPAIIYTYNMHLV